MLGGEYLPLRHFPQHGGSSRGTVIATAVFLGAPALLRELRCEGLSHGLGSRRFALPRCARRLGWRLNGKETRFAVHIDQESIHWSTLGQSSSYLDQHCPMT